MRKIIVMDARTIVVGRAGENGAAQVVWPGILAKWRELYGEGTVQLAVRRPGDKEPYPAVCETDGDDVMWTVSAADTGQAGIGECELSYIVGDTVAKSQTWATMILKSLTGDGTTEPPEEPAKAWFAAVQEQIGDLSKLTTKAKDNLVAAINEAARTGSGGAGSISMRVANGYIQYSTDDGESWENLIAVADLKGDPGEDGSPGPAGHTPEITATKSGKVTTIKADGTAIAEISDGTDGSDGLTPNLQIGSVETLPAGSDATASMGGTAENPLLNLGIPKGADGAGGGGDEWELIRSIDLTEDVASISITTDNSDRPFALRDIFIIITAVAPTDESINYNGNLVVSLNATSVWGSHDIFIGETPAYGAETRTLVSIYNTVAGKIIPTFAKDSALKNISNTLTSKTSYTGTGAIKISQPGVLPINSPCSELAIGSYRKCLYTGANIKIYGVKA